jgi:NitT/TauT family transport system substrate-binding protein
VRLFAAGLLAAIALTACGGAPAQSGAPAPELRLGFFPNVTHATAMVGLKKGFFAGELGGTTLKTATFNSGATTIEALLSGSVDATYIGPNPTLTAYARSHGQAVRVLSGATSGGAALVVKPGINSPADLKGKTVATPGLANTQDVALRWWLRGLGRTDVNVLPQDNAQTLQTFRAGQIDGAWVPEPWVTRLVQEAGAKLLVDERDLWPGGRFTTTQLVVRTEFLRQYPDTVRRLVEGQVMADAWLNAHPGDAQAVVTDYLGELTGTKVSPSVTAAAWTHMTFSDDPYATTLRESAEHAVQLGLLPRTELAGLYDLRLLNAALAAERKPAVQGL